MQTVLLCLLIIFPLTCADRADNSTMRPGGDPGVLPAVACVNFEDGLCPGSADCKCSKGAVCSAPGKRGQKNEHNVHVNISTAANACEAAGGTCYRVIHDECPGGDNCLAYGEKCGGSPGKCVHRAGMLLKAHEWADKKIPYCQCNGPRECCGTCPYCGSFRCDCSGYVSYCWDLPYGYTTSTLHEVAHEITKDELQPGDAMLCPADHVVLFMGWANSQKTAYHACQEPGCHTEGPHHAYCSKVPYPFNWNPACFKPYRLNNVCP
eukprot:TRINITY_DN52787_c0_g1_i1.p1 TRINITY_DN52787_c0_g1~~TRINITY_DN52787_c0_g1_i1.p1  ORF type:complete len:272 (+),score=11.75 TRINITY_DN52787_c0_g1_i1:24-818(+)